MSTEKLSVSFNPGLAATVRAAAAEDGISVSTWLARAAEAQARHRHLREALDEFAAEHGELADDEIDRIIGAARTGSEVVGPGPA